MLFNFFFKHYYQHGLQVPRWDWVPICLSESLLATLSVALASLPPATEVIFTVSENSIFNCRAEANRSSFSGYRLWRWGFQVRLSVSESTKWTRKSFILDLLFLDVNSWLVTFGFHLHNAIPGFPVSKFDLTEPSYELVKSQQWDDVPVRDKKQNCERWRRACLCLTVPCLIRLPGYQRPFFFFFFWLRKESTMSLAFLFSRPGACETGFSLLLVMLIKTERHYQTVIKYKSSLLSAGFLQRTPGMHIYKIWDLKAKIQ